MYREAAMFSDLLWLMMPCETAEHSDCPPGMRVPYRLENPNALQNCWPKPSELNEAFSKHQSHMIC